MYTFLSSPELAITCFCSKICVNDLTHIVLYEPAKI